MKQKLMNFMINIGFVLLSVIIGAIGVTCLRHGSSAGFDAGVGLLFMSFFIWIFKPESGD